MEIKNQELAKLGILTDVGTECTEVDKNGNYSFESKKETIGIFNMATLEDNGIVPKNYFEF